MATGASVRAQNCRPTTKLGVTNRRHHTEERFQMSIPLASAILSGLSTLFNIHKRQIERTNDILSDRKKLSEELRDNCKNWTGLIEATIDSIVEQLKNADPDAAKAALNELVDDKLKIDYVFMRDDSPLVNDLRSDQRFKPFADTCAQFYEEALYLKRILYANLSNDPNQAIFFSTHGIVPSGAAWIDRTHRAMAKVDQEYMKVRLVRPQ